MNKEIIIALMIVFLSSGCASTNILQTDGSGVEDSFSNMKIIGGVNHNNYELNDGKHMVYLCGALSRPPDEDLSCYLEVDGKKMSDVVTIKKGTGIIKSTVSANKRYGIRLNQIINIGLCCNVECNSRDFIATQTSGA